MRKNNEDAKKRSNGESYETCTCGGRIKNWPRFAKCEKCGVEYFHPDDPELYDCFDSYIEYGSLRSSVPHR